MICNKKPNFLTLSTCLLFARFADISKNREKTNWVVAFRKHDS